MTLAADLKKRFERIAYTLMMIPKNESNRDFWNHSLVLSDLAVDVEIAVDRKSLKPETAERILAEIACAQELIIDIEIGRDNDKRRTPSSIH